MDEGQSWVREKLDFRHGGGTRRGEGGVGTAEHEEITFMSKR